MTEVERAAYFHCTMVFLRHAYDPAPLIISAYWHGVLLTSPRGNDGFGYDPIFYLPELQCTAAELSLADKNLLSHHGQALRNLVAQIGLMVSTP